MGSDGTLDVAEQHRVFDLGVEELDGSLRLPVGRHLLVAEEVREHLDEVGLAGAEEPRYPDADPPGHLLIVLVVDGVEVRGEELADVLVHLLRHDEFVKLLPHG